LGILFLLFVSGAGPHAHTVLFADTFSPTGTGPGSNCVALATGYPNLANDRILDETRPVLHVESSNGASAQPWGIQASNIISLSPVTRGMHLHVDLGFQPRSGSNSPVTLQLLGNNASLQVSAQGGEQVITSGSGSGGPFSANSGSNVFADFTYYHFTVDIFDNGAAISLTSDDGQTVFWQYTTAALQLKDFDGAMVLQIYQVTGGGVEQNYVDNIMVTASTNTIQSQNAPGGLVPAGIPGTCAVHFVTSSAKTLMTMYTSGGAGLSGYEDYVHAMQTNAPKGLGNAFDPGPSLGVTTPTSGNGWRATVIRPLPIPSFFNQCYR